MKKVSLVLAGILLICGISFAQNAPSQVATPKTEKKTANKEKKIAKADKKTAKADKRTAKSDKKATKAQHAEMNANKK